ncbi:MAG: hypothetical protein KJ052_11905 [Candidatus Hydrogenedentes bacterium]|nr:hypothetical protein [Candidatus Hydrogenedentota bacterium]
MVPKYVFLAVFFLLPSVSAFAVNEIHGFSNFNPEPELPFEATTFDQDALFQKARVLKGDSVEEECLDACQALATDATAPPELRRYATLRVIEVLTYTGSVCAAVDIGQAWLAEHGSDDMAQAVRGILVHIVSGRRGKDCQPGAEIAVATFDDYFSHATEPSWDLVEAYVLYVMRLESMRKELTRDEVRRLQIEQLDFAQAIAEMLRDDNTLSPTEQSKEVADNYIDMTIKPMRESFVLSLQHRISKESLERAHEEARAAGELEDEAQ